ncbi:SO_0444 family Cu/Zn efflux transporter [Shewanella glacialipiscicola]|uniref:SO_0444 family Cu/Zn efflux transporter n=1 Tax=Shewanella glacialipiscicola TaxID=614069 RepID=UPI0021D8EA30|nr:SO_0444 family Cu/Zn efflux transporter [Shewanella glacialipiscicola]MCU7994803.1 SO_0444 family Cu/Zn efflux transporter [Shewanella glacialipiscicola]MCU8026211.1 SO_0444 family Cu/Zn efflux transporter [Shewanella glacialipiscicola]
MLLKNFVDLFLESAPWLLLGLVLAGLLKVFVPMAWMQKQLGGHGFKTVVKAAMLGAPLPLCSCGVIPAAVGLRRAGASKAATTSFLVSTPETGVDSIAVSYVLLGPFMAIIRPIAAICSAIVAGLLVGRDDDDGKPTTAKSAAKIDNEVPTASCCGPKAEPKEVTAEPIQSCCSSPVKEPIKADSCCSSEKKATIKMTPMAASSLMNSNASAYTNVSHVSVIKTEKIGSCCSTAAPVMPEKIVVVKKGACCDTSTKVSADASAVHHQGEADSCCASTQDIATELKSESVLTRVVVGLKYAATDLVRDTTLWLLVGLFFAALVQTYVPGDFLAKWGDGILAMLVMVLISVPMYICATASTPIAAGLLLAGVSPGAVLVFMMTGPATNIATLGIVTKELGKRALWGYLGGVVGVALIAGMLVNYLVATFGFVVMPQIGEQHEILPEWLVATSGILLALLMAKVIFEKIPRSWLRRSDCCS